MMHRNTSLEISDDESNSIFMFELTKTNLSSLNETWSQTCNINNLTWQIGISKEDEYLSVYLYCEPSNCSELWCCTARVRLVLRCLKDSSQDYSREFVQMFSSSATACGYVDFVRWSEVLDPSKGYVVEDAIKIQAHINANAPQNVDPSTDDEQECPQNFETWKTLLLDDINVKIVRRISEELKELSGTVELGQKTVVRALDDRLKKTLDAAIAPVLERIDSLQETLENITPNQNSVMANFSKEDLKESMSSALFPVEKRILSFLEMIRKSSSDNVAMLVNQFKLLSLKDKENSVGNGTMTDSDEKNVKKTSISGGEPILLSILKILHELRNHVRKESFFLHRQRFPSVSVHTSDDFRSCNGFSEFSDHHTQLKPDTEPNHVSHNGLAPCRECFTRRSTPYSYSTCCSTAPEQRLQKKQNASNSSCMSLPHLFQKSNTGLEKQICDETGSNLSSVSCSTRKSRTLKSEVLNGNKTDLQSCNSSILLDGMDANEGVINAPKKYSFKELYQLQNLLEKFVDGLGTKET